MIMLTDNAKMTTIANVSRPFRDCHLPKTDIAVISGQLFDMISLSVTMAS